MKIEKFEDIIAWQKANELTLFIYKALKENKDTDSETKFKERLYQ